LVAQPVGFGWQLLSSIALKNWRTKGA
jgi:hypothetical protein